MYADAGNDNRRGGEGHLAHLQAPPAETTTASEQKRIGLFCRLYSVQGPQTGESLVCAGESDL